MNRRIQTTAQQPQGDNTVNDFKSGDRVKYAGSFQTRPIGTPGTVVIAEGTKEQTVRVIFDGDTIPTGVFPESIQLVTTRDTITINRADLPKVTETDGTFHCGEHDYFTDTQFPAAKHRQLALQQLAVAEFLDVRAKDADTERDKRRDELAGKFAPGARWSRLSHVAKRAIDYAIELEDKK